MKTNNTDQKNMKQGSFSEIEHFDVTEKFNVLHKELVCDGDVADVSTISHEDSEKRTKRWFRERNKMEEIQ